MGRALRKLRGRKSESAPPPAAVPGLLGESEAIRRAGRAIERAAASDGGVLLGGEDGTGKELVARIIHHRSARAHGPFLSMYCRSVAPELLHEELLGARGRPGLLARAAGGTLFVADIEEVGAAVREKLALLGPPARPAREAEVDVRPPHRRHLLGDGTVPDEPAGQQRALRGGDLASAAPGAGRGRRHPRPATSPATTPARSAGPSRSWPTPSSRSSEATRGPETSGSCGGS